MRAIILAAGRGSRMNASTHDKPKCLVKINGKPLIEYQLKAFRKAGISEIGVVTGYKSECLKYLNLSQFHNKQWGETNMVMSLACANEWLMNSDCIISYSDIFYESSAITLLKSCTSSLALTFDPNWLDLWCKRFENPLLDAETFKLKSNMILSEIGKKPKNLSEIHGQYMGLLKISPVSWNQIKKLILLIDKKYLNKMDMTTLLQFLINKNKMKIKAIKYERCWGEVDTEKDLILYQKYFKDFQFE